MPFEIAQPKMMLRVWIVVVIDEGRMMEENYQNEKEHTLNNITTNQL